MKNITLILAFLFLIFFNGETANITWTNGNTTNNWNDPLNWSTGAVPGNTDIAIFDGTSTANCSINVNANVQGFTVNSGYTGTITQNSGITITIGNGDFNQSDGTFSGGDSNIDINSGGTFTLSGGTFTSTSATLSIGGAINATYTIFLHSGGTFAHNSGKVHFDPDLGGCATRTVTATVTNTTWTEFYDLEVTVNNTSCTEDRFQITTGDTLKVLNDFTHSDGFINGGTIWVEGDMYLNTGADGGNGAIYITGSNVQNYHNSGTGRTAHLYIDKTANGFSQSTGTNFSCQRLTLEAGTLTAPSGTFSIGGTWGSNITILNYAGGTYTHNNGQVSLDPDFSGCATRTATVSVTAPSPIEFYDFQVDVDNTSCTEDRLSIGAADTIKVLNDFTHTDGFINTGTIWIEGDITLEAGADGGSGTLYLTNTNAQQYHNSSTGRFPQVKVDKAGGSVTPGTVTDLYIQGFHLVQGSFTGPTGTMYVGGPWGANVTLLSHSGGTYTHNNGQVSLDPDFSGCATRTATVSVTAPSPIEFYDFQVDVDNTSCTEDRLSIGAADTIKVLNDFTHTDGFINTGTIWIEGDITLEAGADGGSGTLYLTNTNAQQYHNSSTGRFPQVKVDKAGGSVTPGTVTDLYIQGFHLVQGSFTGPTGTMYVGGPWGANVTLLSHSGGTYTHNNGQVSLDPDFSGCATRTATVSVTAPSPIEFYDFQVDVDNTSCTEDRLSIGAADTIKVLNDFTHTDGFINTGTIWIEGDITLEAGADGGSGTLYLTNTNAQQYHNSSTGRFPQVKVDKAGGSVTPGTVTDLYIQGFHLVQGSFTGPTGTMYVGGPWGANVTLLSHSGGTYTHNNGQVSLDPDFSGCATRTATVSVTAPSPIEFYDFQVDVDNTSCTEDRLNLGATDTVKVFNDFVFNDGFINGNGVIWIEGDIYINAGADGGSGTLYLTNTNTQEYFNSSTSRFPHIKINKSAGSVDPGGATTSMRCQSFTLEQGIFNSPSTDFRIGGTWGSNIDLFTHSGGTFNHNNSVTYFDPDFNGCGVRTATVNVIPATEFDDLFIDIDNVSCTEDRMTITAGDTLHVLGTLTLNDGQVNTGKLGPEGNVDVEAGFDGGNAELVFSGSNAQDFDLTGATGRFNGDIKLNKPNEIVTLQSVCIMDAAGQELLFSDGRLVSTSTNLLTIGDNVTTSGANDSSFVQGMVRKIGNDAFTFPIGNQDTIYAGISISAPGAITDTFDAEYFHTDPHPTYDENSKDVTIDHISSCEYWILDRTGGSSNVSVTLSWKYLRSCYITDINELTVARWDGSQWRDHGNGGTTGDVNSGTAVTSAPVTTFSPFTLASTTANNPLPIELLLFDATLNNEKQVDVVWETEVEINNDFFTVEKSENGVDFIALKEMKGAGNSNHIINYSILDRSPYEGVSYYRLKQTDFDGSYSYSRIVTINNLVGDMHLDFNVYPNPTADKLYITVNGLEDIKLSNISFVNALGRQISPPIKLINNSYIVDLSKTGSGVYFISLHVAGRAYSKRVLVSR